MTTANIPGLPTHLQPPPGVLPGSPEWEAHVATVRAMGQRARATMAQLARTEPNAFCEFVLKDEKTGAPIKQAPMHRVWHDLVSAHDRLVLWSHVEGGKTSQLAVGRTLFELGRDPSLRACIVSNTGELAKKMTRQVGQYIEKSPELHEVFPNLLPTDDPNLTWRAVSLTVRRPGLGSKDPSVQATGVHGNVMGSRIDFLMLDDVLDHENTNTPAPREDVWRWVKSTLFSRLTEGARVVVVGNAWHPEDFMHRLEKEDRFVSRRFPVVDAKSHELTWPARWSRDRIELARQDLGPLEYARQLLCQARDDTSARFKREWIDDCLKMSDGIRFCDRLGDLADELGVSDERMQAADAVARLSDPGALIALVGGCVVTGVDLAVSRTEAADLTALFTIWVMPDGTRRVLNVEAGKWTGPETIGKIQSVYERFGSVFMVENNAAQDYLLQFVRRDTAVPVHPFTTGRNKAHPEFGVESLAAELAGGKWRIPNVAGKMHKEVSEWVQELLFYDPREHTGDRLMASWFAREAARRLGMSGARGRIGVRCF